MHVRLRTLLASSLPRVAALPLLAGCASLSTARPLEPGTHEVGATLGGAFVQLGGAPIPVPNVIVQGQSGVAAPLDRPLSVDYGLNLTALPFGVLQGHVGAAWLLAHQRAGVPAVSLTNRLWFGANLFGLPYKADTEGSELAGFAVNQLEVDVSWKIKQQLLYLGLAQYVDVGRPALTLTPTLGATFDPGKPGGVRLHLETRWYAVNQRKTQDAVRWVGHPQGAFGASLGVSYLFGRPPR